ncbi:MAG: hypothetical protein ABEJ42_05735 [Halobacteriaceae archaeon]
MTDGSPAARLREFGPEDPAYDALLVAGPVVLALVALLGRSTVTTGLVGAYVLAFVVAVLTGSRR